MTSPPVAGDRPRLRLLRLWWLAGWAMVLFICYATLAPGSYVPDLHIWDKLEHALAFFGLTFWFGALVRRKSYPFLVLWMLVFGAAIEVAQGTMGLGRDMDIHDWYADTVGVAAAIALDYAGLGTWMALIERWLGLARESS